MYDEIEDEQKIREILEISGSGVMEKDLEKLGYAPFCVCKTTRKKYKKGVFNIDIDSVEYGDFEYKLAEIEIMVEDKPETGKALEKIMEFANEKGLKTGYVRGKVLEYLKKKKPEHFRALIEAGVVRES